MNMPNTMTPERVPLDRGTVETLALEMQAPVELIQRIYEEELLMLRQNARITQFLDVIATRKVRQRMRKH